MRHVAIPAWLFEGRHIFSTGFMFGDVINFATVYNSTCPGIATVYVTPGIGQALLMMLLIGKSLGKPN